jgi:serine/threonine-protein kinase
MEVIAWNIDSIHQEGIFHRDIKPENILFPRNPLLVGSQERRIAVKMGDFGTVRWVNSFTDKYDAVIIGSQCYMSPEQIHNPRHLDPRTDIYSFGVVCYELLYGMHPKNVNSDTSNLLEKLVMAKPVRRRPPVGFEGLNDIIFKCMRSKHRRHQSMHEVVQELHAFNASCCPGEP